MFATGWKVDLDVAGRNNSFQTQVCPTSLWFFLAFLIASVGMSLFFLNTRTREGTCRVLDTFLRNELDSYCVHVTVLPLF